VTGRLEGKVAIITGAGSGIGRATAEAFAAEGAAAVVIVDRDRDGADATVEAVGAIAATGSPAGEDSSSRCRTLVVEADVTDVEAPARTVAEVLDRFGRVDVLLTAAGVSVGRTLVDTDPDDWDRVFAVNVKGTYLWMRAALPPMIERGAGSVITIASQLAVNGGRANTAYIASKGAVISLTRTTALDCARSGVRVNSILPGATETPLLERSFARLDDPETARARSLARHPMGRFGQPEEIATAAVYLASDESAFTTGTELRVDGGWIAG
jgi:NAD(P)-dependent dehydrogenase (short-subunit alcohol dehydrogenase family)